MKKTPTPAGWGGRLDVIVPWAGSVGDQPLSLLMGQPPEVVLILSEQLEAQPASLETAPGAAGILSPQEAAQPASLETAPGAGGIVSPQEAAQPASLETAPGAASPPQEPQQVVVASSAQEPQHSPLVAPGAAWSWLWVVWQPAKARTATRVAAEKRVFIINSMFRRICSESLVK